MIHDLSAPVIPRTVFEPCKRGMNNGIQHVTHPACATLHVESPAAFGTFTLRRRRTALDHEPLKSTALLNAPPQPQRSPSSHGIKSHTSIKVH